MTTLIFVKTAIFQPLSALATRLRNFYRRPLSVMPPPHSSARAEAARRRHPAAARLMITPVNDPDGDIRLVGVRGPITTSSVTTLIDALDDLGDGLGLHLDLSGAPIHGAEALRRIETTVDELERRGVKLRVVGVDPTHPALVAQSQA